MSLQTENKRSSEAGGSPNPNTKPADKETSQDTAKDVTPGGVANKLDDAKYPQWPTRFQDILPEVRPCTYHEFKNFKRDSDVKSAAYALYGKLNLKSEIKKEKDLRDAGQTINRDSRETVNRATLGKESNPSSGGVESTDSKVLHRIRIQSPFILKQLYRLIEERYATRQHVVFFRPFKILIHLQPQMKEALEDLREKWESFEPETQTSDVVSDQDTLDRPSSPSLDFDSGELLDSKYAFEHLEAFVKFIDQEVMPLEKQFDDRGPPEDRRQKVAFEDLSYLFREGQFVYRPLPSNKTLNDTGSSGFSSSLSSAHQTLWKVYSIVSPVVPTDPDHAAYDFNDTSKEQDQDAKFELAQDDSEICIEKAAIQIYCYYIDFDGDTYTPVYRSICINKYEGEKSITKHLPIYPTTYLGQEQEQKLLEAQRESGRQFVEFVRKRHVYHFGWTIGYSPHGSPIDGTAKYPEYIDSEFIIDFREAFQNRPLWKPECSHDAGSINISMPKAYWTVCDCTEEDVRTWRWSTCDSTKKQHPIHDCCLEADADNVGQLRRNDYLKNNLFLSEFRKGNCPSPQESDLCLLPKRLVGFALRERKFVNVAIGSLRHIKPQDRVFDMLKIDMNHKKMVRSLVKAHFRSRQRKQEGEEVLNQDMIRGKGTGLVFLLHGVPGVGKTATAEAVAQESEKPLFAITCGDLGIEPTNVEQNLTRIFRWATIWGCILLLDEADVFFTRRSPSDLQRNALVTVFLRILEYYRGILFLTTNRVGTIDEAFKSRIHMSLYYPPLDLDQTLQIFQVNIDRLKKMEDAETDTTYKVEVNGDSILMWAENHFRMSLEFERWNGRQIRNAFQTAASLAHYDAIDSTLPPEAGLTPGVLNHHQFNKVFQATRQFETYMSTARKGTDQEWASREGIRAKDLPAERTTPIHQGHMQGYRSPPVRTVLLDTRGQQQYTKEHMQDPFYSTEYMGQRSHSSHATRQFESESQGSRGYNQRYPPTGQAYNNNHPATMTPSRVPAEQMSSLDSGISLDFGHPPSRMPLDTREEISPQRIPGVTSSPFTGVGSASSTFEGQHPSNFVPKFGNGPGATSSWSRDGL